MKFSDFLQTEMDKRDWSNAKLAKAAGLSRQAIGYYLSGRIPDRKALAKIAAAFDMPLDLLNHYAEGGKTKASKDEWLLGDAVVKFRA